MIIWKVLNIDDFKVEYFGTRQLPKLCETFGLNYGTVKNSWSKAKKEHPQNNELEIFIIVDKYKITKEKVN